MLPALLPIIAHLLLSPCLAAEVGYQFFQCVVWQELQQQGVTLAPEPLATETAESGSHVSSTGTSVRIEDGHCHWYHLGCMLASSSLNSTVHNFFQGSDHPWLKKTLRMVHSSPKSLKARTILRRGRTLSRPCVTTRYPGAGKKMLTTKVSQEEDTPAQKNSRGTVLRAVSKRWPNGVVPYILEDAFDENFRVGWCDQQFTSELYFECSIDEWIWQTTVIDLSDCRQS